VTSGELEAKEVTSFFGSRFQPTLSILLQTLGSSQAMIYQVLIMGWDCRGVLFWLAVGSSKPKKRAKTLKHF